MFSTTDVNYGAAFKGLAVPTLSHDGIQWAVGSLGAILMPYNLYLHSALVLSRWVGSYAWERAVHSNLPTIRLSATAAHHDPLLPRPVP